MDFEKLAFRMAIDLTPILPGGENGGAKIMTLELIKTLRSLAPNIEFVLLTSYRNHTELAALDFVNVRRVCVDRINKSSRLHQFFRKNSLLNKFKKLAFYYSRRKAAKSILKELSIDLLFCPFTVSAYHDAEIPTVATIYDLQYRYYPAFFSEEDYQNRDRNFKKACKNSQKLVCISDYVRLTVLENSDIDPDKVETVHIQMPHRLPKIDSVAVNQALEKFSLTKETYFLYPANFWQHKNHEMLFTAFSSYCKIHPNVAIKLVCTGHPDERMKYLAGLIQQMGLKERIIFPGYLTNHEFAALLQECKAVIFPSLYEGFGMPVIEAMAYKKPVLCSAVTSLPEIAADAAIYFDPKKPRTIVEALLKIDNQPALISTMVESGLHQANKFGNLALMAQQYLKILADTVQNSSHAYQAIYGIYPDGWSSNKISVVHGVAKEPRTLELNLSMPEWLPTQKITIKINASSKNKQEYTMERNSKLVINQALLPSKGQIDFVIKPVFRPDLAGINEDNRILGCLVSSCRIIETNRVIELC